MYCCKIMRQKLYGLEIWRKAMHHNVQRDPLENLYTCILCVERNVIGLSINV